MTQANTQAPLTKKQQHIKSILDNLPAGKTCIVEIPQEFTVPSTEMEGVIVLEDTDNAAK